MRDNQGRSKKKRHNKNKLYISNCVGDIFFITNFGSWDYLQGATKNDFVTSSAGRNFGLNEILIFFSFSRHQEVEKPLKLQLFATINNKTEENSLLRYKRWFYLERIDFLCSCTRFRFLILCFIQSFTIDTAQNITHSCVLSKLNM